MKKTSTPFNLDKALKGDPIITREGKIVSNFRRKSITRRLLNKFKYEGEIEDIYWIASFSEKGQFLIVEESANDLFML